MKQARFGDQLRNNFTNPAGGYNSDCAELCDDQVSNIATRVREIAPQYELDSLLNTTSISAVLLGQIFEEDKFYEEYSDDYVSKYQIDIFSTYPQRTRGWRINVWMMQVEAIKLDLPQEVCQLIFDLVMRTYMSNLGAECTVQMML